MPARPPQLHPSASLPISLLPPHHWTLTGQNEQRREAAGLAKLDVGVQPVAHHDRPRRVEVVPVRRRRRGAH